MAGVEGAEERASLRRFRPRGEFSTLVAVQAHELLQLAECRVISASFSSQPTVVCDDQPLRWRPSHRMLGFSLHSNGKCPPRCPPQTVVRRDRTLQQQQQTSQFSRLMCVSISLILLLSDSVTSRVVRFDRCGVLSCGSGQLDEFVVLVCSGGGSSDSQSSHQSLSNLTALRKALCFDCRKRVVHSGVVP